MSHAGDSLSTTEVADLLNRSARTVKFWCKRGWIHTIQSPGGRYRITRAEVERIKSGAPLQSAA